MSSQWTCAEHGAVQPWHAGRPEALAQLRARSQVPLWAPHPPPPGWTVGGVGWCGDDRAPASATLLALSGPSPLGGPADLLLVAEEPGTGLGARLAGIPGVDPGGLAIGAPEAKLLAAGHPTALWRTASAEDRCAFVGEAMGVWLWAVLWPPAAELVLMEHVTLQDLRDDERMLLELPHGAPSPRLP